MKKLYPRGNALKTITKLKSRMYVLHRYELINIMSGYYRKPYVNDVRCPYSSEKNLHMGYF